MTKDLYNLKLLAKLTVLHPKILFSLAIAAIAGVILMWISPKQVPSLHRVAPKNLKLAISSHFWPFMAIFALMSFVMSVVILLLFEPTSISYALSPATNLSVRSCSSPLLPPIRSMSNRRLHIGLPPMEMDV